MYAYYIVCRTESMNDARGQDSLLILSVANKNLVYNLTSTPTLLLIKVNIDDEI